MKRATLVTTLAVVALAAACSDNTTMAPTPGTPSYAKAAAGGGVGGGSGGVVGASLTGMWNDPTVTTFNAAIFVGSPFSDVTTETVVLTLKQSGVQLTGELRVYQTTVEFGPNLPPSGVTQVNGPIARPAKVTGTIAGSDVTLVVTGDMFDAHQPNLIRTLTGTLSADGTTIAGLTGSIFEMPAIGTNWSFVRQ